MLKIKKVFGEGNRLFVVEYLLKCYWLSYCDRICCLRRVVINVELLILKTIWISRNNNVLIKYWQTFRLPSVRHHWFIETFDVVELSRCDHASKVYMCDLTARFRLLAPWCIIVDVCWLTECVITQKCSYFIVTWSCC